MVDVKKVIGDMVLKGEGTKMVEKTALSTIVSTCAKLSVRRIIFIAIMIFVMIVLGLLWSSAIKDSKSGNEIYLTKVENNMQEKIAFIDAIASGVSSGSIKGENYYDYVDTMVSRYDDVSAVYVCVPESGTIYKDGIMTYMSGGWLPPEDFVVTDRAWFKNAIAIQLGDCAKNLFDTVGEFKLRQVVK